MSGWFHSIVVVFQDRDDIRRRLWEDGVSTELGTHGVEATASYHDDGDAPPSRNRLQRLLREGGLDGAVLVRPLPAERESHWVPGWTSEEAHSRYDPWRNREVVVVRPRVHPGYRVVDSIARAQVTVWAGGDDPRMVWAATVETENPATSEQLRGDVASGLVPALTRAGLLPPRSRRRD